LKIAAPMTTNILKGAYSTDTKTISTELPDGQDSRGLIPFANTTRIKPNLHWKSSLEVSGFESTRIKPNLHWQNALKIREFEDIGLKCRYAYLSDN